MFLFIPLVPQGDARQTHDVHSGINALFQVVKPHLKRALSARLLELPRGMATDLVITGHSLGGALATLAAFELSLSGYQVRQLPFLTQSARTH